MFFSELRQVLLRRWYLVLAGVLVSMSLGYAVSRAVPPSYSVTAETLMLPPATSVPPGSNPYLALGGLDAAADVLSRSLSSEVTVAAVEASGGHGEYSVGLDRNTPAPLVLLTATSSDAADATKTMNIVLDHLPKTLQQIQRAASVPQDAYITSTLVTKSAEPDVSSKPQLRILVIALAGSLALSLMLIAAIDALILRTRRGAPHRSSLPPSVDEQVASRSQRHLKRRGRRPYPERNRQEARDATNREGQVRMRMALDQAETAKSLSSTTAGATGQTERSKHSVNR